MQRERLVMLAYRGGWSTRRRYGSEYYREIGRLGGKAGRGGTKSRRPPSEPKAVVTVMQERPSREEVLRELDGR